MRGRLSPPRLSSGPSGSGEGLLRGKVPLQTALFQAGFRCFFLLAAGLALLQVSTWAAIFLGKIRGVEITWAFLWHRHEMLFGFPSAVLAGFLTTALPRWVEGPKPNSRQIQALAAIWCLGRLSWFLPSLWLSLAAVLVFWGSFLSWIQSLVRPSSRPWHRAMVAIVLGLSVANIAFLFAALEAIPWREASIVRWAANLWLALMLLVLGRILPYFLSKALQREIPKPLFWERVTPGLLLLYALSTVPGLPLPWGGSLAFVLAGALALRARGWFLAEAWKQPLLAVLYLGYLWAILALGIQFLASWDLGPNQKEFLHFVTVGGLGSLTQGLMVRVSLGHTGRPLAAPRGCLLAFLCMQAAAWTRAVVPLLFPSVYPAAIRSAAIFWALSWAAFLFSLGSTLWAPRADGLPG